MDTDKSAESAEQTGSSAESQVATSSFGGSTSGSAMPLSESTPTESSIVSESSSTPSPEPSAPAAQPESPAPAATPFGAPVTPTAPPAATAVTETASNPTPSGPVVMGGDTSAAASAPVTQSFGAMPPADRSKRKFIKPLLIAVAAVLVIGGGSAAAYFGVVVPNQPANVLQSALFNTAQQKQVSFDGTVNEEPASGSGAAVSMKLNGQADAAKKAVDVQLGVTVSGIDFSADVRYVNKDAYIKLGDLKTLASLLNSYSPALGDMAKSVSDQVSNKWIKVDKTLIESSSSTSCVLNADFTVNDQDEALLKAQYKKYPFVTIKSTASDTVNGKKVEKFVLSLDDDKLAKFGDNLNSLSFVKALKKCDSSNKLDTSSVADHDHTPVTLWIDKSTKQIVKVAGRTTAQDAKKDDLKGDLTMTLDYDKPVNITAPANSTPVMQLLGSLKTGLESASSSSFQMF